MEGEGPTAYNPQKKNDCTLTNVRSGLRSIVLKLLCCNTTSIRDKKERSGMWRTVERPLTTVLLEHSPLSFTGINAHSKSPPVRKGRETFKVHPQQNRDLLMKRVSKWSSVGMNCFLALSLMPSPGLPLAPYSGSSCRPPYSAPGPLSYSGTPTQS